MPRKLLKSIWPIQERSAALQQQFSEHVLDATDGWIDIEGHMAGSLPARAACCRPAPRRSMPTTICAR